MASPRALATLVLGLALGCGAPRADAIDAAARSDAASATDAAPRPDAALDDSAYLFDQTQVRELRLEIPPASWAAIDAEAVPGEPTCRTEVWERSYYTGSLVFEGQRFDGVGVRVKGGCGTSRHLDQKASFLVNLEWDDPAVPGCPAERRLHGQKHLTLNNLVQDATYLHEALGYALYRQLGAPAPRTAYYQLYVNDTYVGLYLLLETIDRPFLKRWYGERDGMMYENGRPYCDLYGGNVGDQGCFTREFVPSACHTPDAGEDPRDWSLLTDLTSELEAMPYGDGFLAAFQQRFDVESFFTTWAVSSVIRHADTYFVSSINNYRVYHHPPTDRWSLIQAGLDWSFWTTPVVSMWDASSLIGARCLAEPACTDAYVGKVRLAQAQFGTPAFIAEAERLHAMIWPYIQTDPRREYVYDGAPYTTDADFLGAYQRMRAWLPQRAAELDAELAERGY